MQRIISFEIVTNAKNEICAIFALVVSEDESDILRFFAFLGADSMKGSFAWINGQHLSRLEATHETRDEMLESFAEFYLNYAKDADLVTLHSNGKFKLFSKMIIRGLIDGWYNHPPFFDIFQVLMDMEYVLNNYCERYGLMEKAKQLQATFGIEPIFHEVLKVALVYKHYMGELEIIGGLQNAEDA